MNIVDNAMGFVLKCRAKMKEGGNPDRLCRIALRSFEKALYSNPKHAFALRNYASTLAVMGRYRQADEYFRYALEVDSKNVTTLFEYCCFLVDVGSYRAAYSYFEKLILLRPPELFQFYRVFDQKLLSLPISTPIVKNIQQELINNHFPKSPKTSQIPSEDKQKSGFLPKQKSSSLSKKKRRPLAHAASKLRQHKSSHNQQ